MKAINLKTEHLVNPIGIDIRTPYLSWNCEGGKKQTAYEIEAVSEGEVILSSGKIASDKIQSKKQSSNLNNIYKITEPFQSY